MEAPPPGLSRASSSLEHRAANEKKGETWKMPCNEIMIENR